MYIPGAGEFRVSWAEGVYLVALAVNVLLGLGGGMPWGRYFSGSGRRGHRATRQHIF